MTKIDLVKIVVLKHIAEADGEFPDWVDKQVPAPIKSGHLKIVSRSEYIGTVVKLTPKGLRAARLPSPPQTEGEKS